MDLRDTFATNMRKYRKAAHLSQEKLAELAGLHRTYIGGIEQRRVNVSLKNIGRIADALNVDPAVLFLSEETTESHLGCKPSGHDVSQRKRARECKSDEELKAGEAAVVIWTENGVMFRPLESAYQDITTHILIDLIERGYTGDELVEQYRAVADKISDFLKK